MVGEAKNERDGQMTRTLITAIFLTLFSQAAWANEMPDKGKYNAMIKDGLDRNGADCRLGTYSVKVETSLAIIFSITCTRSSYLKEIEMTCAQTSSKQCFVSGY